MYKINRIVVLPEYQGFGIARLMIDEIAKEYKKNKLRLTSTTSHPALIQSYKNNDNWVCLRAGRVAPKSSNSNGVGGNSRNRLTTSWEYIGK